MRVKKRRGLWYRIRKYDYHRMVKSMLSNVNDFFALIAILLLLFLIPSLFR